jgi:hypothetical protein
MLAASWRQSAGNCHLAAIAHAVGAPFAKITA